MRESIRGRWAALLFGLVSGLVPGLVPALACALMPGTAAAQTLTVSAASSLTDAIKELGARFEQERPGVKLRLNFGASGLLVQQIIQGAPVDVFLSADEESVERGIVQKVLDPASRRHFASNSLVMIVPATGATPGATTAAAPATLAELAAPAVRRIGVGKPASVPAGRYTRQALEAASLWDVLEPKFVYADNVRQILDYVARGEVEAGFVYRTDALLQPAAVRVALVMSGHRAVRYPAVVVADSRQRALAAEFVDYLFSPMAQAVFARHGYGRPS